MPEYVHEGLTILAQLIEIIGASALIIGFIIATIRCIREIFSLGRIRAYQSYRNALGRTLLIGLEILVAATIIKTITVPLVIESFSLAVSMTHRIYPAS